MTRIARTLLTGLAITGAAAAVSIGGVTTASASQYRADNLVPGAGSCTASQYASYQVRADAAATGQGAKFKLVRNGAVVANTPSRSNAWAVELRSSFGTFPGPGYYSVCAQNTGSASTSVTMSLRTDGEF